jgi:hypothetical protein
MRRVRVLGAGAVGPHGLALAELCRRLEAGESLAGRVPPFRIEDVVPTADPRGLDPSSRYLTAAAALALADAGVAMRGAVRERSGLFVGLLHASPHSVDEYKASVDARGLRHLSAPAFTRLVLNAAAGACSKLLALRGPITALTTGPGSGLVAVVYAARSLAARRDADLLIAAGLDELDVPKNASGGAGDAAQCEGAACLVLAAEIQTALETRPAVTVAGYGLAGPGNVEEAIEQAAAMAQMDVASLRRAPTWASLPLADGVAPAAGPVFACAAAAAALRREGRGAFLITDGRGKSASAAVILAADSPVEDHGA